MARTLAGSGRVTLFPMLHMWPDVYGVGAYTRAGHFGATGVVGYIPIAEVPDMSWLDVAARHLPPNADPAGRVDWVLCTAWSSRVVVKPGTWDLPEASWSVEVDTKAVPRGNDGAMYGHSELVVGRFAFTDGVDERGVPLVDEVMMARARALLPSGYNRVRGLEPVPA
ncbi:hypothetical protein [Streptomyces sp. NBC_01207]|uniref:hypothetical protein n=1 Tax=Streptomyces sp. NBC_01207 TaxID=2903772 RepID=UPI002E15794B|nr:hypothetical protein OG457_27190 [Streptomyces sp. NBC_01207]